MHTSHIDNPESLMAMTTRDEALRRQFSPIVETLHVPELIVPIPRREPTHIDEYSLVAVTPWALTRANAGPTLLPAGNAVVVPNGIETTFDEADHNPDCLPFLDARQAIGLVFGKWLVAVAAAGIAEHGTKIVQIQDVSDARTMPEETRRDNGLRNGFWWQDTLVHAWERVSRALHEPRVIIQSNQNNKWQPVRDAGDRGYNVVAKRRHYSQAADGDWHKIL